MDDFALLHNLLLVLVDQRAVPQILFGGRHGQVLCWSLALWRGVFFVLDDHYVCLVIVWWAFWLGGRELLLASWCADTLMDYLYVVVQGFGRGISLLLVLRDHGEHLAHMDFDALVVLFVIILVPTHEMISATNFIL